MKFTLDINTLRRALRALKPFASARMGQPSALLIKTQKEHQQVILAIENGEASALVRIPAGVESCGEHVVDMAELMDDLLVLHRNLQERGPMSVERRQLEGVRSTLQGALRLTSEVDGAEFRDIGNRVDAAPDFKQVRDRIERPCTGQCDKPAVSPYLLDGFKKAGNALGTPLQVFTAETQGYIATATKGGVEFAAWIMGQPVTLDAATRALRIIEASLAGEKRVGLRVLKPAEVLRLAKDAATLNPDQIALLQQKGAVILPYHPDGDPEAAKRQRRKANATQTTKTKTKTTKAKTTKPSSSTTPKAKTKVIDMEQERQERAASREMPRKKRQYSSAKPKPKATPADSASLTPMKDAASSGAVPKATSGTRKKASSSATPKVSSGTRKKTASKKTASKKTTAKKTTPATKEATPKPRMARNMDMEQERQERTASRELPRKKRQYSSAKPKAKAAAPAPPSPEAPKKKTRKTQPAKPAASPKETMPTKPTKPAKEGKKAPSRSSGSLPAAPAPAPTPMPAGVNEADAALLMNLIGQQMQTLKSELAAG